MKFITVRDLRTKPAQIWKELPKEQEMIITNNGRPIGLLTPLNESNIESNLSVIRKARAIEALREIQFSSLKNGLSDMTLNEINSEIKDTRKKNK